MRDTIDQTDSPLTIARKVITALRAGIASSTPDVHLSRDPSQPDVLGKPSYLTLGLNTLATITVSEIDSRRPRLECMAITMRAGKTGKQLEIFYERMIDGENDAVTTIDESCLLDLPACIEGFLAFAFEVAATPATAGRRHLRLIPKVSPFELRTHEA